MTRFSPRRGITSRMLLLSFICCGGLSATDAPPLAAQQPGIAWYDDFQAGWAASKRTGRPMLIYITPRHCHYCTQMKQQTLDNDEIVRRVSAEVIAVRLNPEDHGEILAKIRLKMYPTTLVAWPRGKVANHRVGFQTRDQLAELLDHVSPRRPFKRAHVLADRGMETR